LTTKVVALADALGNLVRFVLLPGQRHDSLGVDPLITDIELAALIADKAFDNNAIRAELTERGALAVIPSKGDRKTPIPHDAEMCKWRHLIENCFQRLKEFRPPHRHTLRQDRHQLRCRHPPRRSLSRTTMNVYRP
jgi:transposase